MIEKSESEKPFRLDVNEAVRLSHEAEKALKAKQNVEEGRILNEVFRLIESAAKLGKWSVDLPDNLKLTIEMSGILKLSGFTVTETPTPFVGSSPNDRFINAHKPLIRISWAYVPFTAIKGLEDDLPPWEKKLGRFEQLPNSNIKKDSK